MGRKNENHHHDHVRQVVQNQASFSDDTLKEHNFFKMIYISFKWPEDGSQKKVLALRMFTWELHSQYHLLDPRGSGCRVENH